MDRLWRCPHCGELPFDIRKCKKCSRQEHVRAGRFVVYDQGTGGHVSAWICSLCYAEEERLRPYLRTWVPTAVVVLLLVVGILVVEFIAVAIVTLWSILF